MIGIGTRTDTRANEKWEVLETGFQINVGKGGLSESWGKGGLCNSIAGSASHPEENGQEQVLSWRDGWWGWWMTPGS